MPPLRLLYLHPDGLLLARWHKGTPTVEARFPAGPDGAADLAHHLAVAPRAARRAHHLLLVDLPDESFQLDTLPLLRGRDRSQLIARRQSQHHLDTPYLAHLTLGRRPASANDPGHERIVFAALTRPAALEPWLDALRQHDIAPAGIHGVAMLGSAIGAQLTPLTDTALLACFSPAGLRISCLDRGRVRFSRLAVHLSAQTPEPWRAVHDEIQRTHHYLLGQRALERGGATPVFILAPASQHTALRTACPDTPDLQLIPVDLQAIGRRSGLRPPIDDIDALPLLLHLAARQRGLLQFAPAATRRHLAIHRLGAVAGLGAALLSTASLVVSAHTLLDTRQIDAQVDILRSTIEAEETRGRAIAAATPPLPQPLATIQAILARHAELQQASGGPAPFLHQLAQALDHHPGIDLRQLDWALTPDSPPRQHIQLTLTARGDPASFLRALQRLPGAILDVPPTDDADVLRSSQTLTTPSTPLEIRLDLPSPAP